MKRVVITWLAGYDESNRPIFRRQTINVPEMFEESNAQNLVELLDKYSKYSCESAQVVITKTVGDER
ncbi:hypothetical protein [Fervidobacterium thailandense]|uniref:DUF1659 domain-containing protein n=1 Tax=Fervidobacterium thailandense TaxID=1008305 RepID=A0A1E3G696_9BACT|nr:hypothetical protein [Fervidobacterium thailandense]ODN31138.1 hypothetical protein A4H02_02410 [Fervidobacterium thailandense]